MPDQTEPIDFNSLVRQGNYSASITSETSEDAQARREREAENAEHRRRIEFLLVIFTLCLVTAGFIYCLCVLTTGSADDKKLAQSAALTIVTAFVSGTIGYAMKR